MSGQTKEIVRRSLEAVYNRGDLEAIDGLVSSDFVVHLPDGEIRGPGEMKRYVRDLRTAFPDLHLVVEDQVAEGTRVVTRWTADGTHTGPFMGIPATGKRVSMSGIDINIVEDGTVLECWSIADTPSLLQRLGVVPAPRPVGR